MRTQDITSEDVRLILDEIDQELENALQKYPSPNTNMAALTGEVGELANAMNKEPAANVRAEAVQVAVMAIRVAIEGDPYIDLHRRARGLGITSDAVSIKQAIDLQTVVDASDLAVAIVEAAVDAYSYDTWGRRGFIEVAQVLIDRGFTPQEILGVLCSKEMRWAADSAARDNEAYSYIPGIRFAEYEANRQGSGKPRPVTRDDARRYMWDTMPTIVLPAGAKT